jgi:hypothetical protein
MLQMLIFILEIIIFKISKTYCFQEEFDLFFKKTCISQETPNDCGAQVYVCRNCGEDNEKLIALVNILNTFPQHLPLVTNNLSIQLIIQWITLIIFNFILLIHCHLKFPCHFNYIHLQCSPLHCLERNLFKYFF